MNLFLCMVLESVLFHSFTSGWPVFPAPLVKEIVFSPLYIFASFVKDKVSIGVWTYLWAFYFVPLIYISVFVPVLYCLDGCISVVKSEVRQADSSSSILLSQDCFGYLRFFLYFHTNCEIICSSSVKKTTGSLIGIVWIYRLLWVICSFSLYWFFQSMDMVYFSIYLCHLWLLSSVFYSFLYRCLCCFRKIYS